MMNMDKKAQGAVEYLVTYSWMLIALVAIIAALYYLGVLNPSTWFGTSNEVTGLSTFTVTDFTIKGSGNLTLYLVNSASVQVNITGIRVKGASLTNVSPTLPLSMNPGQNRTITCRSGLLNGTVGDTFYGVKFEIVYDVVGGGTNHTDAGTMRGKIS